MADNIVDYVSLRRLLEYHNEVVLPAISAGADTKNTAGATNSSSKLFLIGATAQGANPQTYSQLGVFAQNGRLFSNNSQVVNLDDTQTIAGSKVFTNVLKIQNGSAAGAFLLGADVNAKTLTVNTRKLGRLGIPAYNSNGGIAIAGISLDSQASTNFADFGGHVNNTSSVAPDVIRFIVAATHNNAVSASRITALTISNQDNLPDAAGGGTSVKGIKAFLPIIATNGVTGDLTGTASNSSKLNSKEPSYYLDYTNFKNTPTSLPASDVYDWAKNATKPSYSYSEIANTPDLSVYALAKNIPTKLSQLTNDASLATESFVSNAIASLVDSSPGTLDTLNELAAALGDDPNFATTVTGLIAAKMPLAGGTFTGPVSFSGSNALPQSTGMQYILGITAFASGGQMQWANTSAVTVGSATKATNDVDGNPIKSTYLKTNALQKLTVKMSDGTAVGEYTPTTASDLTIPTVAGEQGPQGVQGIQGYGYVAAVARPSFTESQWATYGTIGRSENWSNTEDIRNGCRIGDIFLVMGTATDTGNAHVLYFRSSTATGTLYGSCIGHSIANRGATGATGATGSTGPTGPQGPTGASVQSATAGTTSQSNGYTITPITFTLDDGSTFAVNVQAKNGTDSIENLGQFENNLAFLSTILTKNDGIYAFIVNNSNCIGIKYTGNNSKIYLNLVSGDYITKYTYDINTGLVADNDYPTVDSVAPRTAGIYYVDGSSSTTAGTWLGDSDDITEYYDGLTIAYKIGIAGASTTTLNINGIGAKTIYRYGTTKLTTQYGVNYTVLLVYRDGAFYCNADYDSTDAQSLRPYYAYYYTGSNPLYDYKICGLDAQGRVQPLTLETGTGTNKTVNTVALKPDKFLWYSTTTDVAANSRVAHAYLYLARGSSGTNYTFNSTITTYKEIYLKGTYNDDTGLFTLDNSSATSWYVQVPYNSTYTASTYFSSGYQYIYLGRSYSSNNYMYLEPEHQMYEFDGTNLKPYTSGSSDSLLSSENYWTGEQYFQHTAYFTNSVNITGGALDVWDGASINMTSSVSGGAEYLYLKGGEIHYSKYSEAINGMADIYLKFPTSLTAGTNTLYLPQTDGTLATQEWVGENAAVTYLDKTVTGTVTALTIALTKKEAEECYLGKTVLRVYNNITSPSMPTYYIFNDIKKASMSAMGINYYYFYGAGGASFTLNFGQSAADATSSSGVFNTATSYTDVIPDITSMRNLGTSAKPWNNVYVNHTRTNDIYTVSGTNKITVPDEAGTMATREWVNDNGGGGASATVLTYASVSTDLGTYLKNSGDTVEVFATGTTPFVGTITFKSGPTITRTIDGRLYFKLTLIGDYIHLNDDDGGLITYITSMSVKSVTLALTSDQTSMHIKAVNY